MLPNNSWPQPPSAGGCGQLIGGGLRRAQRDCIKISVSASVEAPREAMGGLGGCSPRRPPIGGRSRSARGQGRLRWRVCLCARCICGASPHLSVPRQLPKNAHAHLLRVAWQVAGASKRLLRPTTTSISSPWRPRRGPWDSILKIRPSTLDPPYLWCAPCGTPACCPALAPSTAFIAAL